MAGERGEDRVGIEKYGEDGGSGGGECEVVELSEVRGGEGFEKGGPGELIGGWVGYAVVGEGRGGGRCAGEIHEENHFVSRLLKYTQVQ